MKKEEKNISKLADIFKSDKSKIDFNADYRLDYYKDRKKEESTLSETQLEKIKTTYVGKILGFFKVYLVDGNLIRTSCDIDFVAGGNPARYAYNSANELWVDEISTPIDFAAILLHEFVEFLLMKEKSMSYDNAHEKASAQESKFRKKFEGSKITSYKEALKMIEEYLLNKIK